jgi:hypothetical protein
MRTTHYSIQPREAPSESPCLGLMDHPWMRDIIAGALVERE